MSRWMPLERLTGLLLVALVSTLTLEWISLGGFLSGNIKLFHLAAIGFMTVWLVRFRPSQTLTPIVRRYAAFYGSWVVYLWLVMLLAFFHRHPYGNPVEVIRQGFYGSISVFVAAFFTQIEGRPVRRILLWSGVFTAALVAFAISTTLLSQGQNPVTLVGQAISRADPDIVSYALLRSSFRSEDLSEVGANLRHKVFSPVLAGLAIGLICREAVTRGRGPRSRWRDRILRAGTLFGACLVVFSLSRSLILCVVGALGLYALPVVIHARARPRQFAAIVVTVIVILGVLISPVGTLIYNRFTSSTGSYEGRASAIGAAAIPASLESIVIGAEADEVTKSPHNVLLEGWLSAGLLGLVTSSLVLGTFFRIWFKELRRHVRGSEGWVLSLNHLWLVAIGIVPLIRAFTAGQGWHLNEWLCIGVIFGLVEANRQAAEHAAAAAEAAEPEEPMLTISRQPI